MAEREESLPALDLTADEIATLPKPLREKVEAALAPPPPKTVKRRRVG